MIGTAVVGDRVLIELKDRSFWSGVIARLDSAGVTLAPASHIGGGPGTLEHTFQWQVIKEWHRLERLSTPTGEGTK